MPPPTPNPKAKELIKKFDAIDKGAKEAADKLKAAMEKLKNVSKTSETVKKSLSSSED